MGSIIENARVPPAAGCVVSIAVDLDGHPDLLAYSGFHQIFFYGDYKPDLAAYPKRFRIEPVLA